MINWNSFNRNPRKGGNPPNHKNIAIHVILNDLTETKIIFNWWIKIILSLLRIMTSKCKEFHESVK